MRIARTVILFSALMCLASFAALGGSKSHDAEYVYGSVTSIPANAPGSLDLTDPVALRFRHGKVDYRLPYGQIKNFQFTEAKAASRTIAHVRLPKLPFGASAKILDLSFRDDKGGVGTASFRLSGKHLDATEWALTQRMEALKTEAKTAQRSHLPESWWGDKYWKTNRNKAGWPDADAPVTGTK